MLGHQPWLAGWGGTTEVQPIFLGTGFKENLNAAIIAALIAATAALITSIVSLIGQRRTTALQHKLEMQRDADNRAAQIQQIMTKYRQPLLQAATDLQSRLYNIVRGHLLQVYGRGSADERAYTIESTLFTDMSCHAPWLPNLDWTEGLSISSRPYNRTKQR